MDINFWTTLIKAADVQPTKMGDLFHDDVPSLHIERILNMATHAVNAEHTFLFLTKRPERMVNTVLGWASSIYRIAVPEYVFQRIHPNLWFGVTVENQKRADERIPILLTIPAAVRFVSVEPMLGPIYLGRAAGEHVIIDQSDGPGNLGFSIPGLNWVICGGESGPGARPMHPDWPRSLRDQCVEAGVPFMFKQWGEWCAPNQMPPDTYMQWDYHHGTEGWNGNEYDRFRVGKKKAGRLLDGKVWDQYPNRI